MAVSIVEHFEKQAESCDRMGSPFTAELCRLLPSLIDETTQTGRRIANWPGDFHDDALALRLCGGLHALVLAGRDEMLAAAYPPNALSVSKLADAVRGALARHDAALAATLDSAPQTNEIARSAMLLPGFLTIARETGLPLDLHEIGSSAGLNLLFDHFHYRYGDAEWGDAACPVRLSPEVRGDAPPLDGALSVVARRGSDIAPIDVAQTDERLRLTSYVWADQTARLERLAAAIELAGRYPFQLEKADAAPFVEAAIAKRRPDSVFVLFHSVMWQYLPLVTRARIERALAAAGQNNKAPLAWLRMEQASAREPYAQVQLTMWPGGETRQIARCDFHGRWIEWVGE
ncbi:hypothetical protein NA8A_14429 [Nitratireductor indicus C115]|uniref:DUF2332 domain-containing protein n=1 Tax=Nitratireductor indicus C115 TaxID=1231190 RepID=K2P358_9HYPH|nr:DUF2332 family protein [Nitratireductor indicus]EKF41821.1 hypothetical protein NA8A_14429 [Nitratireductor indicus C115]SFQ66954.1 hypothetical protein SAMN05216176_10960 [Nitratireductor indicus]